jgi:DNA polymerase-3 subunit beta
MLKALAARGAVDLRIWDTAIAVEQEDFSLFSKLIDGTYPDIDRVIPSGHEHHAVLSPAMIIPAIKRAASLCRAKTLSLKLIIDADEIVLQMRDMDGGKVTETVELPEPATRRFEHGVNGRYLADVLGSFDGPARYTYSDPASPLVLYSADAPSRAEAGHIAVLMPMRV